MPITVTVTVRDGRDGDEVGGPVIMGFETGQLMDIGERIELADGSVGKVKQSIERSDSVGVSQSVTVVAP
jgi:hypothetical protein